VATIDYALLAEYAHVDAAGLLTVVGASFDRVRAANPGSGQQLFVALRVLLDSSEESADFQINVRPPSGQYAIGFTGQTVPNAEALPVDGKIAVVITVGVMVPLPEAGRYSVAVSLGDDDRRELPFIVEHVAPGGV